MDPIRAEAIRGLYRQMRMGAAAGLLIISYFILTALASTAWTIVAAWGAAALALQTGRLGLIRAWERADVPDAALSRWARLYVAYQAMSGILWGSTCFLFIHPDQPVTVGLTLACMFAITSGSLPALAYLPASAHAMLAGSFALLIARMLTLGGYGYSVLALASGLFGLMMVGFTRNQKRIYDEGFRIRFENRTLVEQLTAERAEAEEARRRAETANLAKSQFLAAASHDLRQPLYALSLFSASLETLKLDEEGRRIVGRIGDSIAAMESLFTGLLDVSRLEAGTVTPRLRPVAVDALFDQLSQYSRPIARERGLDLRFRCDGEWILSDPTLIEQVLSNLVSNALRATMSGGVLVAARRRGAGVRLEVWDTGVGIAPADLERIFDEFVQLGNPERDRRKGLGLGLAIARRASALLGAQVEVASRTDLGSRFALTQPAAAAPGQARPEGEQPAALPRDRALPILVVDDDVDVRAGLTQLLGRWGVPHDAVASADAAMTAVAARRYGLVLSDQRLGGAVDGLGLLRRIGGQAGAGALITGELDPLLADEAGREGWPVLLKPVRPEALRALLGLDEASPPQRERAAAG